MVVIIFVLQGIEKVSGKRGDGYEMRCRKRKETKGFMFLKTSRDFSL